jgi:hypothetical protein
LTQLFVFRGGSRAGRSASDSGRASPAWLLFQTNLRASSFSRIGGNVFLAAPCAGRGVQRSGRAKSRKDSVCAQWKCRHAPEIKRTRNASLATQRQRHPCPGGAPSDSESSEPPLRRPHTGIKRLARGRGRAAAAGGGRGLGVGLGRARAHVQARVLRRQRQVHPPATPRRAEGNEGRAK